MVTITHVVEALCLLVPHTFGSIVMWRVWILRHHPSAKRYQIEVSLIIWIGFIVSSSGSFPMGIRCRAIYTLHACGHFIIFSALYFAMSRFHALYILTERKIQLLTDRKNQNQHRIYSKVFSKLFQSWQRRLMLELYPTFWFIRSLYIIHCDIYTDEELNGTSNNQCVVFAPENITSILAQIGWAILLYCGLLYHKSLVKLDMKLWKHFRSGFLTCLLGCFGFSGMLGLRTLLAEYNFPIAIIVSMCCAIIYPLIFITGPLKLQKVKTLSTVVLSSMSEPEFNARTLIADPEGFKLFLEFCRRELSVENILFFAEVNRYRAACEDGISFEEAWSILDRIFTLFLYDGGELPLNISWKTRKAHIAWFESRPDHLEGTEMNEIQDRVFALMKRDTYHRFRQTAEYREFQQKLVERRTLEHEALAMSL